MIIDVLFLINYFNFIIDLDEPTRAIRFKVLFPVIAVRIIFLVESQCESIDIFGMITANIVLIELKNLRMPTTSKMKAEIKCKSWLRQNRL